MAFSNALLAEFDLVDGPVSFSGSDKSFGTLSLWATEGGGESGTIALELKLELETNSAGILGEASAPLLGVFVETGTTGPLVGLLLFEEAISGSGGSAGMRLLLLPEVVEDSEAGNAFVELGGGAIEPGIEGISRGEKPEDALPPLGGLRGGKLASKFFDSGNGDVEDCPSGDALLLAPKFGAGVLLKESNPMDGLAKLPDPSDPSGPLGPETSGKLSSPMRPSRSGFIGVCVPLSATYPPYKTNSNNTTTTAVFKVCTAVLPDRKF